MEKHNHTVHANANGSFALKRDGVICLCPKTLILMPIIKMQQQAFQPTQMPCQTSCPFASLSHEQKFEQHPTNQGSVDVGRKYVYRIECEGRTKEIWLDEDPAGKEDKKESSKILSMP